jgi:hypothetical protein
MIDHLLDGILTRPCPNTGVALSIDDLMERDERLSKYCDHLNAGWLAAKTAITALEAENAALKAEVASFRSVCSRALSSLGRGGYLPDIGAPLTREMQKLVGETP